jgi:pimeloyl-ACP methyl ester carboxylesterase
VDSQRALDRLHEERTLRAGGRPVRALVSGERRNRDTPPVVLVPGLGAVGYCLDLLHACGAWTAATLLDLPGFGRRETADLPAGLDPLAATLADALPEGPTVLVGHSTGAQVALRATLLAPGRVRALVLVGPTFEPASRRARSLVARSVTNATRERPRELRYALPDYVRGGRRLAELVRDALRDRPEDAVGSVECPVVVVRGARDPFCSQAWAQRLAATAPRGGVRTLPGAHNIPYTCPGALSLVIAGAAR